MDRAARLVTFLAGALMAAVVLLAWPHAASAYPVTTISGVPEGWSSADVTVKLTADPTEGSITWYTLDGGPAQIYTRPFTVSSEGTTTIVYWSRDGHTAMEEPGVATVRIDKTPPVPAVAGLPTAWVAPGTLPVTLTATDALSGVASVLYRLDGGPTCTAAGPVTIAGAAAGWLECWAVDAAGNTSAVRAFQVLVDTGAPLTVPAGCTPGWSRDNVRLSLDATAPNAPVATTLVSLGAAPTTAYAGPVTVTAEGTTTVLFRSIDTQGREEATRSIDVRIDRTPPVSAATGLPTGIANAAVTVALRASDAVSGVGAVLYSLDGGPVAPSSGTVRLLGGSGTVTLEWWAVDVAGNEEAHHTASVRFDTVGPVTSCDAAGSYTGTATIALTGDDGPSGSGVAVTLHRLDGGLALAGSVVGIAAPGVHTLEYWSVDAVGNAGPHGWATFTVLTVDGSGVPPTTTVPPTSTTPPAVAKTVVGAPQLPTSARHGRYFTITGTVRPRLKSGTAVRIVCYRLVSGHWRTYTTVRASVRAVTGGSRYSVRIRLSRTGHWRMRAYATVGGKRVYSAYRSMRIR